MLIVFYICISFILFSTPAFSDVTSAIEKDNENVTASVLPPTAEKLVRYRRQPPFKIIKHVTRSTKRGKQRRRIKAPKIKYGPPNFSAGEPVSYNPHYPIAHSDDTPSYSVDDFPHLSLDGPDFQVPSSSYETQAMNLDFYHHDDSPKAHPIDYTFDAEPNFSVYSIDDKKPLRVPHQEYGVPQQNDYSSAYNSIDIGGTSSHYESPETFDHHQYTPPSPVDYSAKQQSYGPQITQHTSSSQYAVPSVESPPTSSYSLSSQTVQNDYVVYDKKIPNVGYHPVQQNFAEPPPVQHSSNSDYEISYSPPAYEITSSSSSNDVHFSNNFKQTFPSYSNPDTFEEHSIAHEPQPASYNPSPHQPPSYQPPSHQPASHQPPSHQPPSYQSPSYQPPSYQSPQQIIPHQEYSLPSEELPLNQNSKNPPYDFPKSSYEVPIYDPIPFEASNQEGQESFPPFQSDEEHLAPTADAAPSLNSNFGSPSYNSEPSSSNEELSDVHTSGSSKTTINDQSNIPRRKKKRIRGPGSLAKHSLDVPELQKAFETENHKRHRPAVVNDAETNESEHREERRTYQNLITSTTSPPLKAVHTSETFINHDWNPIRTRTSSTKSFFTPTIIPTTSLKSTESPVRSKQRTPLRSRQRSPAPLPSTVSTSQLTKSTTSSYSFKSRQPSRGSTFSIEKSHSNSYYDGTVEPPADQKYNGFNRQPNRHQQFTQRQPSAALALKPGSPPDVNNPKRTTKSVFDTTYFKSPRNDKVFEQNLSFLKQNLPKNHKLF